PIASTSRRTRRRWRPPTSAEAIAAVHVAVATIVHHPQDARILHREIRALLDRDHRVTYLAPFGGFGVEPPPGVTAVDVRRAACPRSTGGGRRAGAVSPPGARCGGRCGRSRPTSTCSCSTTPS